MSQAVDVEALKAAALANLKFSYCPYSNFHVSAAIWCENGSIDCGTNVENVSYGLTVCAERTAVFKAVTSGRTKFRAIAICSSRDGEIKSANPCGACRQVLAEFGMDLDIYVSKEGGSWTKTTLKEVLPMAFSPECLAKPSH